MFDACAVQAGEEIELDTEGDFGIGDSRLLYPHGNPHSCLCCYTTAAESTRYAAGIRASDDADCSRH